MDIFPFQNAGENQRTDTEHAGNRVIYTMKSFGQPQQKGDTADHQRLFFKQAPGAQLFFEHRHLEFGIGPEDQVGDPDGSRYGNQGTGQGIFDPVEKCDFEAGEFLQKCSSNHAASAAHQRSHATGRAGKCQRDEHKTGGAGVGLDADRAHQRQHGDDADSRGGGIVYKCGRYAQADGQNKSKANHAAAGLFYDKIAQAFGQPGLVQRNGEDQTAHNENDDRVHIGRPGLFDIRDPHDHQKDTDTNGRNFERDRLRHEQKNQYHQDRQKALGSRR